MHLKLNTMKTELIWFDRRLANNNELTSLILNTQASNPTVPSKVVRNLGVLFDEKLTMINHISTVTRAFYFHLRRIRQPKQYLNEHCLRVLVQALVISRLDYCNSVLVGLPKSTLQPLTSVLHSAARVIKNLKPRDHITTSLQQLH
jgi:hypothetical protein